MEYASGGEVFDYLVAHGNLYLMLLSNFDYPRSNEGEGG